MTHAQGRSRDDRAQGVIPRSPSARAACLAFALTFPVGVATMNRTIGFVDRGELAAVAATFGIPHATGYPTLMLLAGALVRIVPLRATLTLNLFAALLTAAGAAVLVLLFDALLAVIQAPGLEAKVRARYALLAGTFVAFTMTWWQQANGFEVYALHALMMPLVVLLFLRWSDAAAADDPAVRSPATRRAGFAFALVVGLALTNHMTTVLLAPALITVTFLRFGRSTWRRILPLAPAFTLGLLPYLWLPLRARMHPRFDWGHTDTLRGFLHHVTGGDYHGWMFAETTSMALQNRYLMWRLPGDFAWIGLMIAGLGAILMWRRARHLAVMAALILLAGWVFATGYRIPDLDAYLLTAVLGIGLCFAAGLLRLHERFGARVATIAAFVLVLVNLGLHWRECDERESRWVESFVHDLLGPLPHGAVLFTDLWDIGAAGTWYFQEVERYRPDVVVVIPDLTRVSWYLEALQRREPELVARAEPEFRAYHDALVAIEHGHPYRVAEVIAQHDRFLEALVGGCARDRAVFATGDLRVAHPEWARVPWHLALWLRPDSAYVPEPVHPLAFRLEGGRVDSYVTRTCQAYAESRLERAAYEARHGRAAAADSLARAALAFDPHVRADQVGPLPLGVDHDVIRTARFFLELSASQQVSARR